LTLPLPAPFTSENIHHDAARAVLLGQGGLSLPALRSRSIGLLCLVVTSVGWGMNWPAMKFLLREWPPLSARGAAGMTAALVIALAAIMRRESLAVPRRLVGRLVAGAFFNVFAWMGFSTLAMRWLSAGQGALLVYTMPIWATLLAWPLLGKRPTGRGVAGLALCIAGIAMLFGGQDLTLGPDKLAGVLLALGAAVLFALGTVILPPMELPPLVSLAWQIGIGCAPMVALGLLFENPRLADLSPLGWTVMAYMTAVPMGLCYLAWFAALRRLPAATASVATLLTPVVGVTAAAFILGEPFGLKQMLALALTIGGVALVLQKA
jgi:drug/metabolite transporter (DMT)-like permease